jgi:hypothetical protein
VICGKSRLIALANGRTSR